MGQTLNKQELMARWRHWRLPAALILLSVAIALGGDKVAVALRYQRDALDSGEWWRLVSGHLVHLGWSHLWMNTAGLAVIWLLVGKVFSLTQWLVVSTVTMAGISLGLYWWLPQLSWYVGLSGLLHGMLMAAGLHLAIRGDREMMAVIAILLAKIVWELWQGPLPGSREMADGEVVIQAHALGGLCGAAWVAARVALGRLQSVVSA